MSENQKDYVKLLLKGAGLTILPDMKNVVESRHGRSICAKTFKLLREDATIDGVKKLLNSSNWKAFAMYTVEKYGTDILVRGSAE
jgi:hypothetical protein